MSLFVRSIRHQSSKIQAFWCSRRCITTSPHPTFAMDLIIVPRRFAISPSLVQTINKIGGITKVADTTFTSIGSKIIDNLQSLLGDLSTWLIKRTFQPSIIRKRRKHGFRRRKESVGGRNVLARRKAKGRIRLGGC